MADNARPPFRADHVGSLLRPKEVLEARDEFARGEIGAEQLAQVENAAIREIIRKQGEVGLKSATDGELRRQSWHMDFIYQLGGIEQVNDDLVRVAFHNKDKTYEYAPPSAHVTAPISLPNTIFADAFTFVRDNVAAGQTPKLTIPSPSMVHYRGGREAISMLESTPDVAIVLMDIMMPEMDGYATMQVIRQNPSFRRLPIIALTAKAMKGDREKCLEAGASEYLAKPVNTEQLLSALRMWLHR